ncbi:benzoate/H(+) symporter BenE family transporter, partial [Acinetobacter nectaris]
GYTPHTNQLVGWIGITQTCFAPFGAFSVCLAAISAAVSLDNQVHPDPKKRYIAGICCGICYIFMGVFALYLTHLLLSLPQLFITIVAGIALLGTISHNIAVAFEDTESRDASLFTFLLSASGIQILGIGSAFWGLLFGILLYKFLSNK